MSPQGTNEDRSARSALISEVFSQYMDALTQFYAVVERCAAKGWPDRKTELFAATRAQRLYRDQELARLNHILAIESDAVLDSFTDFAPILRRLREDWTEQDETALLATDLAYASTEREIAAMRRLTTELDGPLEMASRDPELRNAGEKYRQAVRELQSRLHHASK